jgi:hypothetical protein
MFLQGKRIHIGDNPHKRLTIFTNNKDNNRYKTIAEREEEEYQEFIQKHRKMRDRKSIATGLSRSNPIVRASMRMQLGRSSSFQTLLRDSDLEIPKQRHIRPSTVQSRRSSFAHLDYLQPITPSVSSRMSEDIYNTNYHHLPVVLKDTEIPVYEHTLRKISEPFLVKGPDTNNNSPAAMPQILSSTLSPKDMIAGSDKNGNATFEEYITALRYQEIKLIDEKKRRQKQFVNNLIEETTVDGRWYELKDQQFTKELIKFNEAA